ncbi:MAG: MerR family transcriptional regulator [Nitrospira sp.]|nr:MerR family transcriptional regulator [Nitrospira sp.]
MEQPQDILIGTVIGDESVLSIEELARACGAESQWIIELVAIGVLEPEGPETSTWRFHAADLTCARRMARLQRDFDASLDAAAAMLELLEQIEQLRARLKQTGLDMERTT